MVQILLLLLYYYYIIIFLCYYVIMLLCCYVVFKKKIDIKIFKISITKQKGCKSLVKGFSIFKQK